MRSVPFVLEDPLHCSELSRFQLPHSDVEVVVEPHLLQMIEGKSTGRLDIVKFTQTNNNTDITHLCSRHRAQSNEKVKVLT